MEKITAAIIGLGRIASLLEEDSLREKPCTHAGAIAANPCCNLAAGCDIDEERRRLFAEKWSVPVYADAVEMIRAHSPQILAIATHPDSHYRYCRLAAALSVPVLICEKPLADNLREARKITRLSLPDTSQRRKGAGEDSKNMVIITNHERRYSDNYIRAKAILDDETLGKILSIRAVLYMGKTRRLLDVLWHDGTHLADAIMFLANGTLKHRRRWGAKITSKTGTAWLEGELRPQMPTPNSPAPTGLAKASPPTVSCSGASTVLPLFKAHRLTRCSFLGVPVLLEIGAGRDHLVFEIEFSCEKGRLRIGNGIFEVWESAPSPYAEQFRSLKATGEMFAGPTGYFANMVKDAVECVQESNRQPRSSAANGLKVIEYLNSIQPWL